jgi:hypothetical protein
LHHTILTDARDDLHSADPVQPKVLKELEAIGDLVFGPEVREKDAEGRSIFNGHASALSLICEVSMCLSAILYLIWKGEQRPHLRGSMGWAASPINTTLPLVSFFRGFERAQSLQSFRSSAFLQIVISSQLPET